MGFSTKFDENDYLTAVRRAQTTSDKAVADRLGVDRSTTYRFKKANPKIYEKAIEMLAEKSDLSFNRKNKPLLKEFRQIPVIADWIAMMKSKKPPVGEKHITKNITAVRNVCFHLKTHPEKLDVDRVSDHMKEINAMPKGTVPRGLAYYSNRAGIRSFFSLTQGISGEILTIKGIGGERSEGTGKKNRERITKEKRREFEKYVKQGIMKASLELKYDLTEQEIQFAEMELKALAYFMYYTGSRITSTLETMFNDEENSYAFDQWIIHINDKGRGGGYDWFKKLRGDALEKMQDYIAKRHGIPKDEQALRLPDLDRAIFPTFCNNYDFERLCMKYALRYAGIKARKMQNHIWRHTFAQDWLNATDYNYELGAVVGGWNTTDVMKQCYGAISEDAVDRGLRKAMGEKVENVTYELKW